MSNLILLSIIILICLLIIFSKLLKLWFFALLFCLLIGFLSVKIGTMYSTSVLTADKYRPIKYEYDNKGNYVGYEVIEWIKE